MLCIQFHAPLLPLQSQLKHNQHSRSRTPQLLWLSSCEANQFFPQRPKNLSLLAPRTNAIPYSLLLGVSSEAEPADIQGQLQIVSAVILSALFIAYILLPIFIPKDLSFDMESEEQKGK
ncbi:hypothetical protein ACB092_06G049000 [Castanea dentata]